MSEKYYRGYIREELVVMAIENALDDKSYAYIRVETIPEAKKLLKVKGFKNFILSQFSWTQAPYPERIREDAFWGDLFTKIEQEEIDVKNK